MYKAQEQAASQKVNTLRETGLIESVADELRDLISIAELIDNTLMNTRSRVFGPYPQSGESSAVAPVANGTADELRDRLNALRSALHSARDSAAVLSDRL